MFLILMFLSGVKLYESIRMFNRLKVGDKYYSTLQILIIVFCVAFSISLSFVVGCLIILFS